MRYRTATAALSALALAVLSGTALAGPGAADVEPPSGWGPATPASAGAGAVVTLITGDRVTYRAHPDPAAGEPGTVVSIEPAARPGGEPPEFRRLVHDGRATVLPSDVAHLVPDVLDPALFDVTGLVEAGYDDASRPALPVVVERSTAPGARSLPGSLEPRHVLESIDAVAVDVPRDGMPDLVARLLAASDAEANRSDAVRSAADQGVRKIWLDAPVRALDADSSPQVGAPQAWEAGFTGDGVRIAVVDTGVDAGHPDLAGAVVASKDFTDDPAAGDPNGHGTHVASIAAGRGVVDTANRGVAPDADLIDARVLDTEGSGPMSAVVDAMEWVAAEQDADVINLSLGTGAWTDGTDPLSRAVNRISREHDVLVVAAAGNDYGSGTINSPGAAARALTVGAVDDDDVRAGFSSQGSRAGDGGPKPEIAAPGVGIAAAQAAGTEIGDPAGEGYVEASGTSMATPHVAGAAAVLLEQRPGTSSSDLRSVLTSTAQDGPPEVREEGAGRLWLPGALDQTVVSRPAVLSFGRLAFPQEPVTRRVTYENTSGAPVTLTLAATLAYDVGGAVPAGTIALARRTLVVPAGERRSVGVTIDARASVGGSFAGVLTATDGAGRTLRTPIGARDERELVELRVEGTERDGSPAGDGGDWFSALNTDERGLFYAYDVEFDETGVATLEVPAGTYAVIGGIGETGGGPTTLVSAPEADVSHGTTLTFDAREAVPVELETHRPATTEVLYAGLYRETAAGSLGLGLTTGAGGLHVLPTDPVRQGELSLAVGARATGPADEATDGAPSYRYTMLEVEHGAVPGRLRYRADERNTARVVLDVASLGAASARDTAEASVPGGLYVFESELPTPGVLTDYVSTDPEVPWTHGVAAVADAPNAFPGTFDAPERTYRAGERVRLPFLRQVHHHGFDPAPEFVSTVSATRDEDWLYLGLPPWVDDAGNHEQYEIWDETTYRTRLWRDGELLADLPYPGIAGPTDREPRDYRLRRESRRSTDWWQLSNRVSTEWRFRSGRTAEETALPLLQLDYGLDLDGRNRGERAELLRLSAAHQARSTPSEVEALRLWWSADDGATWTETDVRGLYDGAGWALVRVPEGTERVSLRAQARDAAGSTVRETVIGAYAVK